MTEHESPSPSLEVRFPLTGAPPALDEQALSDALKTRSATVRDVAYGEGVQYSTGRGAVRLEIFPRTGVTRLTAPDVRIEIFGGTRAEVADGGVEFFRTQPGQDASLTVVPDGGIVFPLLADGVSRPADAAEPVQPLSPPAPAQETAPGHAPERPQPATEQQTEATETEAVTMQG